MKALPWGWKDSFGVFGDCGTNIWPPQVGSDGRRIGFGLLIIFVGVTIEIGVDFSAGFFGTLGLGNGDLGLEFVSISASDSQSDTFSLHSKSISSQMTWK